LVTRLIDLRRGRPAFVGVGVHRYYAKLFDGFRIQTQHRFSNIACLCLVNVNAIQRHVGLVASPAGHVASWRHLGLQGQQRQYSTPFDGQLGQLRTAKIVS
jgi:hypothetical protein